MVGGAAVILALVAMPLLLASVEQGTRASRSLAQIGSIPSQPYTNARFAALRAQHRPVFINATAAWCITCLVNEKVAFSDGDVQAAFGRGHVAYLVADWTNRNPEITSLLQAHGRSGVPLYLYYSSKSETPVVLSQVLTPGEVQKAIGL